MERLPDELLIMIFDKLPPIAVWSVISRVCRRWKNLASYRVVTIEEPAQVIDIYNGVLAVYMTKHFLYSTKLLHGLLQKLLLLRLSELVICDQFSLDESCMDALRTNRTIKYLDVFVNTNFPQKYVPSQIRSLVVNNNLRPKFLTALSCYEHINALHMYGNATYYCTKDMHMFVSIRALQLTHLTLRCPEMIDSRWEAIGRCKNLRQLKMYSCWSVRGGVMLVEHLHNLKVLHLTGCRMVRSQALHQLITKLPPSLIELNLSASVFSDAHTHTLATSAPGLLRLELWRCCVTTRALLDLTSRLTSLRDLDTDSLLSAAELQQLGEHPTLRDVRCCLKEQVVSHLRVVSAGAGPRGRLRASGEGPSADAYCRYDASLPVHSLTL